ncbi:MAG TPA: hypothetical protein VIX17_08510 [Pyrinomonadaceae bacterium]
MTLAILINIVGWSGSVAVVAAYSLISLQKLRSDSKVYQWLNLIGSVGLAINTAYFRAYPSTVVNVVWLLIACSALVRIWRKQSARSVSL